jgi:Rap1a immunity proteins
MAGGVLSRLGGFRGPCSLRADCLRHGRRGEPPAMEISDGVTVGQEIMVVVAYIDARPARMHENFGVLALEALRTAWPCK